MLLGTTLNTHFAQAQAHEIYVEALSESCGIPISHPSGISSYVFPLSKKQISRVNEARKNGVKPRLSIDNINNIPHINREYIYEYLTILENDIKDKQKGKEVGKDTLFYTMIGKKDNVKFKLYLSIEKRMKDNAILSALPTDSRMPTRKGEGK